MKFVCMQNTFARATHSAYAAARPSARATIGYLVYKKFVYKIPYRRAHLAFRPSASREQRYLAYKYDVSSRGERGFRNADG